MYFDIKKYQGKYAMHCTTEMEADSFCNYLASIGRTWRDGTLYIDDNNYHKCRFQTVYYFNEGMSGSIAHISSDYTILKWSDFDKEYFNIDALVFSGKIGMHCKNEMEAIDFCHFLYTHNRTWADGESYRYEYKYLHHCERSIYLFNEGRVIDIDEAKENDYEILEWEKFMCDPAFSKKDLKNGDIIRLRNGLHGIIMLEYDTAITASGSWIPLKNYNEDLSQIFDDESKDIIAVRRPFDLEDCHFNAYYTYKGKIVYKRSKRPKVEKMTLEEVCQLLGKKIEIVDSK